MFEYKEDIHTLNNKLNEYVISGDSLKIEEMFGSENQPYVNHEINGVPVIVYAAQRGNWDVVEVLYNNEADLDAKVPYLEWHLVHECIKSAPERVTKAVIEYCNINCQNKDGKTPLMIAIENGKNSMAEYLVDLGICDLSIKDKKFENAAHYAARFGNKDLFTKLVSKGVPMEQKNKELKVPLELIEDITFKENFSNLIKNVETKSVTNEENVSAEITEEVKPKISGLSKIKRR